MTQNDKEFLEGIHPEVMANIFEALKELNEVPRRFFGCFALEINLGDKVKCHDLGCEKCPLFSDNLKEFTDEIKQ